MTQNTYYGIRNNHFYNKNFGYEVSGKGYTGTPALNLSEQLTVEKVLSNPLIGRDTGINMKDYRWNTTENWKKMEYSHRGLDESNITFITI